MIFSLEKINKKFCILKKVCTFALPILRNDSEERQREESGKK
jgi:hypothetical protein